MAAKKYALLIAIYAALFTGACFHRAKNKLMGKWHSKDGSIELRITENVFMMDDGDAIAENYFIKNDTIFTSFKGNLPYTPFVVQKLEDHYLKLVGPDSVAVEYSR
ncbi:MAG TPA: hypothetical protein VIM16_04325 [Mucilaginibacter sp.]|jgi:hypothetical protein